MACGGAGPRAGISGEQVELDGEITAVDSLVGDWVGEFVDVDSGDSGSVRFSLQKDAQYGVGELVMHPNGERHGLTVVAMRLLRIDRAGGVLIRLSSFADPQCRCDIRIELSGQLSGDEISGSYARLQRGMTMDTGHFSMTRR